MTIGEILELRALGLQCVWDYHGDWYAWGFAIPGLFDCSGLSGEYLKSVSLMGRKERITAHAQWMRFQDGRVGIEHAIAGDLVFWFDANGRAIHVEIVVLVLRDRAWSLGASGGAPYVKTKEDAMRASAFIKVREIASRGGLWAIVNPYRSLLDPVPV